MNADPKGFGGLLTLLADRRIAVRFEGKKLRWRAPAGMVDTDVLRLLRRFKWPLRQALGPDRLPEPVDRPQRGVLRRIVPPGSRAGSA
jgi:hypothetical protein